MKFTLKKAYKVGWEGWNGWSYSSKEDFKRASALYIEVTGRHGLSKTTKSDRVYYVIGGKGEFVIDGEEIRVERTDVVIVPRNTLYDYKRIGKKALKLFLVHAPAFDERYVVDLEK
jgi:mannose-6-phosphate isomerase-like protein (cupin superfamily)